ncbi:protein adenylyltransferase SelO, mitochondrial isoform X2 [Patella vulgata]|nr:protein adenylyltransferase SelO, mitochondrial isoform X2 [Patella vulgata]
MFYDGHPQIERAAVVLRLAKSWFRIGSLEILEKSGEIELLKQLVDFIIKHHFPSINEGDVDKYVDFYWNVVNQTASLIALWQSVGFAHGVCNTDNFSLLSIIIDYGPFGFLDEYNPGFVPNTSDDEGRYSYENQPDIGKFNLKKLQTAISPLLTEKQKQSTDDVLKQYSVIYKTKFMDIFRRKLGLITEESDDENLVAILLKMMEETGSDFTMTFCNIGEISLNNLSKNNISKNLWALFTLKKHKWFKDWKNMYLDRIKRQNTSDRQRQILMKQTNPRYILRNWMAQLAITKAEKNDFSEVRKILRILTDPFSIQKEAEDSHYALKPPSWSKQLKVSCSS